MANATLTTKVVTEVATTKEAATLDAETLSAINEFITTRDMLRTLEKQKKELEATIKDGEVRIELSKRERKGVDTKALAEAFPEAFEACQTTTEYTVLVAK
jgi:RPA family protein